MPAGGSDRATHQGEKALSRNVLFSLRAFTSTKCDIHPAVIEITPLNDYFLGECVFACPESEPVLQDDLHVPVTSLAGD